jgi:hypothetical protein
METIMNEKRVKTFIELARQVLEEDRIGQTDLSSRRKMDIDNARFGAMRRGEHGKKA